MRRIALPLALALLAAPLAAMPEAAGSNLETARAALARGDGIAAEADLQRALGAGANRTEIAADMGEALLQQGNRAKAREWLAPGQFAKGEAPRGWRLLALLERLDGNLPAAGKALDKALAIAPRDPLIWVEIARLRYQGGEQLQALEAADRALAAGPDHPRALELKAQLVRDSLGDAAALPWYQQALEQAPDDLLLLGGYAASLGELGQASEMLAVTRKMIALDPRSPQAFYLQAVMAARAGNVDLARAMLNRAGEKLDGVPAAVEFLGILELEAGNANVAVEHLVRLVDRQGANSRGQLLLARALYEAGDHRQLFDRFGPLIGRGDANPYLLGILGRALEEQGDRAGAAALLDRAAAANALELLPIAERETAGALAGSWAAAPGNIGLAAAYLRAQLGSGDSAGARSSAARLLAVKGGSSEALGLAGDVELLGGQPAQALQLFSQSARVRFPDQLALRSAIALERSGQAGQVPALISQYLSLYPGSRLMLRIAANQALGAKDWPRARLLLENLRLRGGNRDARLLSDLSLAQLRSGDAEAALESATRAWEIAPASAFAVQARALALVALERDPDLARQLLDQAGKTGGDPRLLKEARGKLR